MNKYIQQSNEIAIKRQSQLNKKLEYLTIGTSIILIAIWFAQLTITILTF